MIALRSVAKRYGDFTALHPTTIEFAQSQVTALIGPSGCGKSTLLRLVLGLIEPTQGVVERDGVPLEAKSMADHRRRTGYVIQDGGLFPHLTARGNVTLMARFLGHDVLLDDLCELCHFEPDLLDRYPVQLSGGQRQRVGLMRALALDPELLLLDEPLGALDPLVRHTLQTELKELFGRLGKTALLVTHDLAEAAYLADTIVLMSAGAVLQVGTLEDLRERPADPFVSTFLEAQRSMVAL